MRNLIIALAVAVGLASSARAQSKEPAAQVEALVHQMQSGKSDGVFIGRVGLYNPEGWPGLEVGWTLGKPYWRQGYATEAAKASVRYGFLTQPVDRIISVIDPGNKPSQAVALRLGESKGPPQDIVIGGKAFRADIWSLTRAEWRRQQSA